jgi:disease resistance protein
MLQWTHSSQS